MATWIDFSRLIIFHYYLGGNLNLRTKMLKKPSLVFDWFYSDFLSRFRSKAPPLKHNSLNSFKVWTFWETHKIWKNLPRVFDKSADILSKCQNHEEFFFQIMWATQLLNLAKWVTETIFRKNWNWSKSQQQLHIF